MRIIKNLLILVLIFTIFKVEAQQIPSHLNCVKINHLYRKACHNCYEHSVINTFSAALDETRVVELDVHSHKNSGTEATTGVWYVRHNPTGPNNDNNCINKVNGQSNQDFNICLENVQEWSIANPGHDPIIVFIDLKPKSGAPGNDFWRPNHGALDLDSVLMQFALDMGGLDVLYKPSDLRGSFTTAREAALNENWPSLGNMKNKFMFVLTGENIHLNEYLTNVGKGAMAFVAISLDAFANSSNGYIPQGISASNSQEVVFYNMKDNETSTLASFVPNNGLMSRVWDSHSATSNSQYGGSIAAKVNNIAITNIYANNLATNMNYQMIDINNITIGGTPSSPQHIKSIYNSILQSALMKVTAQNLIVESNTTYNIRAGQEVDLLPGTDIQMGANTDISIGNCSSYASNLRTTNTNNNPSKTTEMDSEQLFSKKIQQHEHLAFMTYPNPTQNAINVSYKFNSLATGIFTLYDITGRTVKMQTYQPQQEGLQNFTVDVQNLKEGTYFYTLQVGKQSKNGKVIKVK